MIGGVSSENNPASELPAEVKLVLYEQHLSTHFHLHYFRTQVVAGINYFIKYQINDQYYLGKVYLNTDGNYNFVNNIKILTDDEIHYF